MSDSPTQPITPALQRVIDRILSRQMMPEPPAHVATDDEIARARQKRIADLLADAGKRYHAATLASYEVTCAKQGEVVNALYAYAGRFDRERVAGNGVLLFGPSGTGKDHLLLGAARLAILKHGASVRWRNGVDLYSEWRDLIDSGQSEWERIRTYTNPDVLILSDPLTCGEAITGFQSQVLMQIVDRRYRNCQPTWISLNVMDGDEAQIRMGRPILERLSHGTLVRFCNWPSYRAAKARKL